MRHSVIVIGLIIGVTGIVAWFALAPGPATAGPGNAGAVITPARSTVTRPTAASPAAVSPTAPVRRPTPTPAARPNAAVRPEAAPTTATLRIETDVPDAMVLIDRVGVGTAPITVADLSPGSHTLNVSATGYDGFSETVTLAPGVRTILVSFKEIRLDAKLAAVHKHSLGSCRGQLAASPEGLQYVADDGKDSFAVTFEDVAVFEMDYLDKNLRMRTRAGRTFNFTDPDGNADRLFVFHRDVDKVRKRIAAGR